MFERKQSKIISLLTLKDSNKFHNTASIGGTWTGRVSVPQDTLCPSTFQNEKLMPMKVMNPFVYRTKGKSGVDVKDTGSNTNLFLIINALLILRQADMAPFRKEEKSLPNLNCISQINNLTDYSLGGFYFFWSSWNYLYIFFQIPDEYISMWLSATPRKQNGSGGKHCISAFLGFQGEETYDSIYLLYVNKVCTKA